MLPFQKNFISHVFPPFLPKHNLTKAKSKNSALRRNYSYSQHFLASYLPRKAQALELFHMKRLHPIVRELKLCHGPVTFYKLHHISWKISTFWAKQIMIENGAIFISTIPSLPTCSNITQAGLFSTPWFSSINRDEEVWQSLSNNPPNITQIIIGWNIFPLRVKLLLESINFRFTEA